MHPVIKFLSSVREGDYGRQLASWSMYRSKMYTIIISISPIAGISSKMGAHRSNNSQGNQNDRLSAIINNNMCNI